ncbi:MAG: hypothetical protein ACI837_000853 [Crocinitomicaceae bacterium]|jgi:hypothetical protein
MRIYLTLFIAIIFAGCASLKNNRIEVNQVVEASCGMCHLGLPGDECKLAVRIDGVSYYVKGTTIDDHGDAHAEDGFCGSIRRAKVKGVVKDSIFKASFFELVR